MWATELSQPPAQRWPTEAHEMGGIYEYHSMYSSIHFIMVRTLWIHFTDRASKTQNHQARKWQSRGLNPEHSVSEAPVPRTVAQGRPPCQHDSISPLPRGLPVPEAGMGQRGQTCGACPVFCSPSGFWRGDPTGHPAWEALCHWHCPLALASGYATQADPQCLGSWQKRPHASLSSAPGTRPHRLCSPAL